jgi:hypothetical protein
MATAFNNDKPYSGSPDICDGKLTGRTGSRDYFFFLCPKCNDGQVLRVIEYEDREGACTPYPEIKRHMNLAFHLRCPMCRFEDFAKIDNSHQAFKMKQ